MTIALIDHAWDATWCRAWSCADGADVGAWSVLGGPLGPKRGDIAFQLDTGTKWLYLGNGSITAVTGLASVPIDLSDPALITGRLPFTNLQEAAAQAIIAKTDAGSGDYTQFQPAGINAVLWFDNTDLKFDRLPAEIVEGTNVAIPFNAGDFTGSGSLVWTVTAPQLKTFGYVISPDNQVTLAITVEAASFSGTGNVLHVALPAAITPVTNNALPALVYNGGTFDPAFATMTGGVPEISFVLNSLANFNTAGGTVSTYIVLTYSITP